MPVNDLLIELGTEELPPKSLNRLRLALEENFRTELARLQFDFDSVDSFATPRRLAVRVMSLSSQQPDQLVERKGPAIAAAYDADGNPTRALSGFMRSCGIDDATLLETLKTEKGEWVQFKAQAPGAELVDLLPEVLDNVLAMLPIDRRMRWGKLRNEFVRPVHWLVCLYGTEVVPIQVLGLNAGNTSRGHRFMSNGEFVITSANDYVEACRTNHVIADFNERQQLIATQIDALAKIEKGQLEPDPALLEEVTALVEWPVALAGRFEERFLSVPQEVLISAMKEHQRYFHLVDADTGQLMPVFITVSNIESSNPDVVISGNERVIRPRLSDAAFFFEQDARTPLSQRVENLANVVFQTELGTYREKATRISRLAGFIAGELGADVPGASRAGLLCKADLVSDMVGEFPDLQGIMGGHYARRDAESNDVAEGIEQHYRPIQAGGELPSGALASCVALADKLDTIMGLFGINQPPTGSRDPFALRRQSLGVIRICVENRLDLDLQRCLEEAASGYERGFSTEAARQYIIERLTGYYADQDISADVVDAATAAGSGVCNLLKIDEVVRAIRSFRRDAVAESIIAANKRVANLLKKVDLDVLPAGFDPQLATEAAESALAVSLGQVHFDENTSMESRLSALAELQSPVDRFFDEVLVMADDIPVRNNRLALLRDLRQRFLEVADFSLLQ
ncbi:MAG: glycine--tRNA ligase subunit beta [Proteobacteria bacterium]|nr:glycine--tRNA ligase subunit beta [Pseudomonadota bacterium]